MKIDKKIIKELSDYLDEFNLTELEYTEKDTKIKVSKNNISINNQTNQTLSKEISSNKNIESQNNINDLIEIISNIRSTKAELKITPKLYCDIFFDNKSQN